MCRQPCASSGWARCSSPRCLALSGGGALALVGVAFLWELLGALVGAPAWLLALSPFHHVAAVPQSAFDTQGALAMIAVAAGAGVAAVEVFIRRDLQSG